jgi:carbon-monoxide dehydrogenase large subunit
MTALQDAPATGEVGRSRARKEDRRLITGRTRWTDNITLPGMLHLAMVRSPHAHARILSVDTAAAAAAPGVVAVYSGADLADAHGSLPARGRSRPTRRRPHHPAVAADRVSFSGRSSPSSWRDQP